jgi:hypothetical protein
VGVLFRQVCDLVRLVGLFRLAGWSTSTSVDSSAAIHSDAGRNLPSSSGWFSTSPSSVPRLRTPARLREWSATHQGRRRLSIARTNLVHPQRNESQHPGQKDKDAPNFDQHAFLHEIPLQHNHFQTLHFGIAHLKTVYLILVVRAKLSCNAVSAHAGTGYVFVCCAPFWMPKSSSMVRDE